MISVLIGAGLVALLALVLGGCRALSRTLACSFTDDAGGSVAASSSVSGDTEIRLSFTVAASTTDQEQQFGFDAAAIKAVFIKVDGAITCETNNASSPSHTFAWSAAGHLYWANTFPAAVANPFGTTDVTTTFWTNAGASTVTVEVRILLNS